MAIIKNISLFTIFFLLLSFFSEAKVIKVGKNHPVKSPEKAVEMAQPGDEIHIHDGVYPVNFLTIDKSIKIKGISSPVLDGRNKGTILLIKAASVEVIGLVFKNTGKTSIKDYAGVRVENADNVMVKDNQFLNNYFAIYLAGSDNVFISNNYIQGNSVTETSSGNGIHVWKCNKATISSNTITKQRDGMYLEFAEECVIENNKSTNNLRYGLHFMFSPKNKYIKNLFTGNGAGVAVMYTEDIEMIDNTFADNWGPASYGLLLKEITNSTITGNTFSSNTVGIYMEASSRMKISDNEFSGNGWAMKLLGNCENDTLTGNSFFANTFDLVTNSFNTGELNYLSGNYWDKYKGYDLNKDRVGDVPHRPVSLFSTYVERIPCSVVLLKSFLVDLLDLMERAFPSMIPETLLDKDPLMSKEA